VELRPQIPLIMCPCPTTSAASSHRRLSSSHPQIFFWTPKPAVPRWAKIIAKLPWAFILVVVYTAVVYSLRINESRRLSRETFDISLLLP